MIFRLDMIPTAFRAFGKFLKRVFGPEPIVASDDVLQERRERCSACKFSTQQGQCELCGCMTVAKTLLASECCPHPSPRWKEQTRFSDGFST